MKLRIASGLMAALFAAFAALQYNDPDPIEWMAIYAAAAIVSGLTASGRQRWQIPTLVASVALIWAMVLVPHVAAAPPSLEHLTTWKMMDPSVEESRELFGLVIVFGWMTALAVASRRARAIGQTGSVE